jgi:hypothetical protein
MMDKKCFNCWLYCHSDGKCYGDPRAQYDEDYAIRVKADDLCCAWSPDGLTAEEREEMDALMTMAEVAEW